MLLFRSACCCFVLCLPLISAAQLQKPYGKTVRWATTVELGGLSPIISLNAEYTLIQSKKSFFVTRVGIGQLFTGYSLLTAPHALTWNIVLNGKTKGCPPIRPQNPLFAEIGIGGVYLVGATEETTYRWSPVVGVRHYFAYNLKANGFWKAQLTPIVAGQLVPWSGIGLGLLID